MSKAYFHILKWIPLYIFQSVQVPSAFRLALNDSFISDALLITVVVLFIQYISHDEILSFTSQRTTFLQIIILPVYNKSDASSNTQSRKLQKQFVWRTYLKICCQHSNRRMIREVLKPYLNLISAPCTYKHICFSTI